MWRGTVRRMQSVCNLNRQMLPCIVTDMWDMWILRLWLPLREVFVTQSQRRRQPVAGRRRHACTLLVARCCVAASRVTRVASDFRLVGEPRV